LDVIAKDSCIFVTIVCFFEEIACYITPRDAAAGAMFLKASQAMEMCRNDTVRLPQLFIATASCDSQFRVAAEQLT
jgi:hypothetical protein